MFHLWPTYECSSIMQSNSISLKTFNIPNFHNISITVIITRRWTRSREKETHNYDAMNQREIPCRINL